MSVLPKKAKVLFVDDEEENLKSFAAAYRKRYSVSIAIGASEALKKIENEDFHVVITDQRMPGMKGVELLDVIRKKDRSVITMLITAYNDLKPAIDAVNKGEIFHYITKPWDTDSFASIIDKAFDKYCNELKLQLQNEELFRINRELDKLIYSASHDLRGPLTSILGVTRLMRNETLSDAGIEYLKLIDESVHKLDNILRGLGAFSSNLRIVRRDSIVDMESLIYEVADELAQKDEDFKKLKLEVNVEKEVPLYSCEDRLKIILRQLFLNAGHFRDVMKPHNKLIVSVFVAKDKMILKVKDNGTGISPDHSDRIFEMFYRGTGKSRGAGIGLYIVQEAVRKLDGKVNLSSNQGAGSEFTILIPQNPDAVDIKNGDSVAS